MPDIQLIDILQKNKQTNKQNPHIEYKFFMQIQ